MRFLVDVCAGGKLAAWLREMGYDVAEVRNVDSRMTDSQIIEWGAREQRVIITVDKDFGQLAVTTGTACTSIIRLPDLPFEKRKQLLAEALLKHAEDLKRGCVITASEKRMRVRKL